LKFYQFDSMCCIGPLFDHQFWSLIPLHEGLLIFKLSLLMNFMNMRKQYIFIMICFTFNTCMCLFMLVLKSFWNNQILSNIFLNYIQTNTHIHKWHAWSHKLWIYPNYMVLFIRFMWWHYLLQVEIMVGWLMTWFAAMEIKVQFLFMTLTYMNT
jgi:hypothetical protein